MERETKLNLMRYWIFGTFVIIWTSALIFVGSVLGTGTAIFWEINFWISFIISAVLCILVYIGYTKILDMQE